MARKIIWSPTALEDLRQISDYISRDSPTYAAGTIEQIIDSAEQLVTFPRLGRVVPEFNREEIREVIVFRYRVIYEIEGDAIHIASIVHGARMLKRAMKDRSTGRIKRRRR